jgi:NAD(P)H dehydrogenase (quinone)
MQKTLLVTGAAGQLGQRVIARLMDANSVAPGQIVAATRHPEKLERLAALGVQVRRADFEDPASLAAAFAGVNRMLLISTDAIDRPGRRLAQHKAAIEAARKAGVKHMAYTSMINPEDSLILFAPDHLGTEKALTASGLSWTLLRNSWYMENLRATIQSVLASGKWFTSAGTGRMSYVAREDCARVAAAALASDSTANVRYDVTGPEKHTTAQIAAIISDVYGKPIEVMQVTDAQLIEGLQSAGLPVPIAKLVASFDANTRAGKVDVVSTAVHQLTGRAPQSLRDFLIANKAVSS